MTVFAQSDVWWMFATVAWIAGWLVARVVRARVARLSQGGLWAARIVAASGSFVVLLVLNQALDRGASEEHPARVLLKTTGSTLKGGAYKLHVAATGPWTEPQSLSVDEALHRSVDTGDHVCLLLHPGALGAPYVTVKRSCTAQDP